MDSNSVAAFTVYGGIDITLLQAWFSYIWCKSERCGLAISGTQEGNAIYGTLFNERKKKQDTFMSGVTIVCHWFQTKVLAMAIETPLSLYIQNFLANKSNSNRGCTGPPCAVDWFFWEKQRSNRCPILMFVLHIKQRLRLKLKAPQEALKCHIKIVLLLYYFATIMPSALPWLFPLPVVSLLILLD